MEFQDEDRRDGYLTVANNIPSRLLIGDNPRLFDEWQDALKIWGPVRKSIDDRGKNGLYILTGLSSQKIQIPLRLPDLKLVITGSQFGYKKEDAVYVIRIGCLKD